MLSWDLYESWPLSLRMPSLLLLRMKLIVVRILNLSPKTWSLLYLPHYRVFSMELDNLYGRLLRKS